MVEWVRFVYTSSRRESKLKESISVTARTTSSFIDSNSGLLRKNDGLGSEFGSKKTSSQLEFFCGELVLWSPSFGWTSGDLDNDGRLVFTTGLGCFLPLLTLVRRGLRFWPLVAVVSSWKDVRCEETWNTVGDSNEIWFSFDQEKFWGWTGTLIAVESGWWKQLAPACWSARDWEKRAVRLLRK